MNPCYGTQNTPNPEITARINSYHWLSFLEAYTVFQKKHVTTFLMIS